LEENWLRHGMLPCQVVSRWTQAGFDLRQSPSQHKSYRCLLVPESPATGGCLASESQAPLFLKTSPSVSPPSSFPLVRNQTPAASCVLWLAGPSHSIGHTKTDCKIHRPSSDLFPPVLPDRTISCKKDRRFCPKALAGNCFPIGPFEASLLRAATFPTVGEKFIGATRRGFLVRESIMSRIDSHRQKVQRQ